MSDTYTVTLCYLHEIPNGGSKGFTAEGKQLFVVKKGHQCYLYANRCPHASLPLNWVPDQFLDADKELIQCSSHGALFQIETGRCVAGPCPGKSLLAVPFEQENGQLRVAKSVLAQLI